MVLALEARSVSKRYGGIVALEKGELLLERGEVHVLLGANGCGKSTLCKAISGAVVPDDGEILLAGQPVSLKTPKEAQRAGIATVYQETSLIPTLTVADNILLGHEPVHALGRVARRRVAAEIDRLFARAGRLVHGIDPDALVADLTIDQQQVVEIIKVLSLDPKIIIFDESTSSLDREQVAHFFALVRELQAEGVSVILISHRMEEIFTIGDRVTIMRNGRFIDTRKVKETNKDELVTLMVGNAAAASSSERSARTPGKVFMKVDGVSGGKASGVSLELRQGEVLGLGGLHGQGQSDLLLALYGGVARKLGEIIINGEPLTGTTPGAAIRRGLVYVSGDRGRAGSLRGRPIMENFIVGLVSKEKKAFIERGRLKEWIAPLIERLKVKFGDLGDPIETLSGGNQQKVIIGRGLATDPVILLLDDPTKGIDVQAKRDLFELIDRLCRGGTSVILYSSEDRELLENADRVLVFNSGSVVAEIGKQDLSEFNLNAAALATAGAHG